MAWSPDSRWLAFHGRFNTFWTTEQGVWLVEAATGQRRLIAGGSFKDLEWSPDGQHLVAIQNTGEHTDVQWRIVLMEVSTSSGTR